MNIHDIAKQIRHFADQIESQDMPSPKPDPYAELKKAHAEGKVIECITGTDRRWMAMQGEPRWFLPVEDYRIKPEAPPFQLPPPPPGMRWLEVNGWILVVDKPKPL